MNNDNTVYEQAVELHDEDDNMVAMITLPNCWQTPTVIWHGGVCYTRAIDMRIYKPAVFMSVTMCGAKTITDRTGEICHAG